MQHLLRKPLVLATALAFTVLSSASAFGQAAARATIESPKSEDLPSPEFSGGKQKDFKPKNWIDVEAKVRVQLAQPSPSKVCEKLEVVWYVAVKNPDKPGTFLKLKRTVTYLNVPLDEDVYVSAYLPPSSLRRLTGNDNGSKSAVEYVGLEVRVGGQVVGEGGDKKVGWWKNSSDKISETTTIKLLDKSETPFSAMWWDRYPEIDPTAPKGQ